MELKRMEDVACAPGAPATDDTTALGSGPLPMAPPGAAACDDDGPC